MSHTAQVARDPIARALAWIATRGVELRDWPPTPPDHPDGRLSEPADDFASPVADHPVLYLVAPGMEPPICRDLEDWIRLPLDIGELNSRADRLVAWSREVGAHYTRVDEDDILRVGDDMVVLSELEARLMRALIADMGMLLLRHELVASVWPDGPPADPRALDNRVKSLRSRLAGLPVEIHTVWGRGLLLERSTV